MNVSFNEILGMLRRNKGISQRTAAADLNISQALLSHYENGIREPGLDFVNRACDYYKVSADFLLGRTGITAEELELDGMSLDMPENERVKSIRLLSTAMNILIRMIEELDDSQLNAEVARYIGISIYRIYRYLMRITPDYQHCSFCVPDSKVDCLSDVEMRLVELRLLEELDNLANERRSQSPDVKLMNNEISKLYKYLEVLLSPVDKRIAEYM